MIPQEIEDLFIYALDANISPAEKSLIDTAIQQDPGLAKDVSLHNKVRQLLIRQTPATFGFSFSNKLVARIENTGVIIERQIFFFFKRYQLIAAGLIAALLILNTLFSQELSVDTIFGLDNTSTEDIVSFDFYNTLNNDL